MRRWNGWGDEANHFPLKESAVEFLQQNISSSPPLADATLQEVLSTVPESRLLSHQDSHPFIQTDPEIRLRHARGQSFPDWLAMRSGRFDAFPANTTFPDGVVMAESVEQIRDVMKFVQDNDVEMIIYGGGTSVAGHVTPEKSERPILTLSLENMDKLIELDEQDQLARFEPGANGPRLEEQLQAQGYTLGHYPQSFELSSVGGWVATRSSGQQSLGYGKIEQMFAGAKVQTFDGEWDIPPIPATSAGPDMREWIMGSEGRWGVISEATMRVSKLPEFEAFYVVFFPQWELAKNCARQLVQDKVQLSMLRVSNPVETDTHMRLGASDSLVGWLNRGLSLRGCGDQKCMMTFGISSDKKHAKATLRRAKKVFSMYSGVFTGRALGKRWEHSRFRSPYLRHGLWEQGYAVDTLETSACWSKINMMMNGIEDSIKKASANHSAVHVFTHLSHMYKQGASIYTTYIYPVGKDYDWTYKQWQDIKYQTSDFIIDNGGTISHQHGVGKDHAPWMKREKGPHAMEALEAVHKVFDEKKLLAPGALDGWKGE